MQKKTVAATLLLTASALSGCKELEDINREITRGSSIDDSAIASVPNLATPLPESESAKTQLIVPKDGRTKDAIDAALPTIKQVLGIHACIVQPEQLRMLNKYATSGVDMATWGYGNQSVSYPNFSMKYHNKNRCVAVRSIDQFSMPALNALQFRVVYFATDSEETINYGFLFKKSDNGNWQIAQRPQPII